MELNNLIIRKATFSDLSIVSSLINELIDSFKQLDGIDINIAIKNYHRILRDGNSHMLLAEIDNQIIGFINFSIRQSLLHKGYSGLINELVVSKAYQDQEIGTMLLDAAIKECKNLGCCEIEVSTESANISAIQFYKQYGFDEKGVFFEKDMI